jgi:DNA-binding response OmpR family regulator
MTSKGHRALRKRKASGGAKPKLPQAPLAVGDLVLDPTTRLVHCNGAENKLTPKECRLLGAFMENGGKVLSREYLMKEVWDTDYMGDTRTLDVHIRYLRKKIEHDPSDPSYILTVRGVGYRLELPD